MNSDKSKLSPPIELHGDFVQYANTAFIHGNRDGSLDTIESNLQVVANLMEDQQTRQFFEDPSVSVCLLSTMFAIILHCDIALPCTPSFPKILKFPAPSSPPPKVDYVLYFFLVMYFRLCEYLCFCTIVHLLLFLTFFVW